MTTVLVGLSAEANTDPFVDYRTMGLTAFLAEARVKETA
jgi:hypothetical protein